MASKAKAPPSVDQIEIIQGKGPWPTKSGGELNVLFELTSDFMWNHYFKYDEAELQEIKKDIRGLRSYIVSGLQKGKVGAGEWHKLRSELVFAIDGSAEWACEDLHGNKKTITLEPGTGVYTPPFILHTYTTLSDDTRIMVLASTLFDAKDASSQDSFPAEVFKKLQEEYRTA